MTKVAIKNMTEDEATAEARRIDQRLYELQQQMWKLKARTERMDLFAEGWLKRLDRIAVRLLEIANGVTPGPGEVDQLFADQQKIMARWQRWLKAKWAIYREETAAVHRDMDALYKRSRHVTKRRWQHNYARLGRPRDGEIRVLR